MPKLTPYLLFINYIELKYWCPIFQTFSVSKKDMLTLGFLVMELSQSVSITVDQLCNCPADFLSCLAALGMEKKTHVFKDSAFYSAVTTFLVEYLEPGR